MDIVHDMQRLGQQLRQAGVSVDELFAVLDEIATSLNPREIVEKHETLRHLSGVRKELN